MGEVLAALTPAVAAPAHKLAFRFTANIVESCVNEAALQVAWKDDLQPCGGLKTTCMLRLSAGCKSYWNGHKGCLEKNLFFFHLSNNTELYL